MMLGKKLGLAAVTLAVVGSLLVGPAMAGTRMPVHIRGVITSSASGQPAPNCVTATVDNHWWGHRVHVWNGCRYPVRVKIVMAFWPDGSCHSVPSHDGYKEDFRGGRFDGLEDC
jgi:hypothetical protein